MSREDMIEKMARFMVPSGINPDDPVSWEIDPVTNNMRITARLWSNYVGDVRKMLLAIEASGCAVVPMQETVDQFVRGQSVIKHQGGLKRLRLKAGPFATIFGT